MRIYKQADKKRDEGIPNGETLALYIKSLKLYLKDNPRMDAGLADLISKLPSDRQVRQDFSKQECKLIYETLEYVWPKISGSPIVSEKEVISAPESLSGSYIMLKNGLMLKGVNSYDIIKSNGLMICSLLGISGLAFHEYLARKPNDIIGLILKHGAMRLYIDNDKKMFVQCSEDTYADWGRKKIQKLDFPKGKIVRIVDFKVPYCGWSNGVLLRL